MHDAAGGGGLRGREPERRAQLGGARVPVPRGRAGAQRGPARRLARGGDPRARVGAQPGGQRGPVPGGGGRGAAGPPRVLGSAGVRGGPGGGRPGGGGAACGRQPGAAAPGALLERGRGPPGSRAGKRRGGRGRRAGGAGRGRWGGQRGALPRWHLRARGGPARGCAVPGVPGPGARAGPGVGGLGLKRPGLGAGRRVHV